MKKSLLPLILVISFFIISCHEHDILTDQQKTQISDEVAVIYTDAISNLSKLDMEIWSEPWSKDNFLSVNSGVNYFSTFSHFRDSVEHWFSLRASQKVQDLDVKVHVLSSEYVLITSIANWDIQFKNKEELKVKALATLLWRKEEQGWKIVHLHESWQ